MNDSIDYVTMMICRIQWGLDRVRKMYLDNECISTDKAFFLAGMAMQLYEIIRNELKQDNFLLPVFNTQGYILQAVLSFEHVHIHANQVAKIPHITTYLEILSSKLEQFA